MVTLGGCGWRLGTVTHSEGCAQNLQIFVTASFRILELTTHIECAHSTKKVLGSWYPIREAMKRECNINICLFVPLNFTPFISHLTSSSVELSQSCLDFS